MYDVWNALYTLLQEVEMLRRAARPLLNSDLVKSLRFNFNYYILRKTPIIVYQMGKVGSSSVTRSLKQHGAMVYHVHALNPEKIATIRKTYRTYDRSQNARWLWVYHQMVSGGDKKVKFITLVRDPIAQRVASFFQNLDVFTDEAQAHTALPLDELLRRFSGKHLSPRYPINWFDEDLKPALGIDVYAYPFPKEEGYTRITQGNFDLLVIKLEIDDAIKQQAIAQFTGLDFQLLPSNVGDEKEYGDIYKTFKEQVVIPPETLDEAYTSHYTQHFYTSQEIETMRNRWERLTAAE